MADRAAPNGMAVQQSTDAGVPKDQRPGHPSFRRQRASRACETCHARKVRCDAASLGVPCTNCVAFSIECKIPTPKRKKTAAKKDTDSDRTDGYDTNPSPAGRRDSFTTRQAPIPRPLPPSGASSGGSGSGSGADHLDMVGMNTNHGMPDTEMSDAYASQQNTANGILVNYMRPKFARAPIKDAGRVAYLGESSNLSLLVQDHHGMADVVHYPLPENVRGTRARINELDHVEIDILHQRGAFLLPPRALCDELVDAFFQWIAPVVPVINRTKFMRQYRDNKHPPSLLLLQAILLAGSRVCNNPQLMDATGSTTPAAMTFYKRAKALYDANYEDDRVTIVQALILMAWYWEGPEDVTKNVFYWSRVAVVVAQGTGMHRSVEGSQLSQADKRLWKRIWWTLFTRDRSVAVALGRPVSISIEDSDVEMVSEDDFIEDDDSEYAPDPIHVQFFLNYVKLCEIMGLVLSQQYSVGSKLRRNNAIDLTHSDIALADWLQNCPQEVRWEPQRHHFWSALLQANYYTTLCLLHRAHMPPAGPSDSNPANGFLEETTYPSRTIAYQAAGMITSIIEALQARDQLRYTPAFVVYSLFSALIMHVYQMRSSNRSVVSATQRRLATCMNALREVGKVWLVAKMIHTLFESILGNKALEERLQRAAGQRHMKARLNGHSASATGTSTPPSEKSLHKAQQQQHQHATEPHKRKFDDFELGYSNGPPAPQMSYERSRPQSPAATPSTRELPAQPSSTQPVPLPSQLPHISAGSPPLRHSTDAFMGTSRSNTRPTTPFNGYSYPATPPDLFLHTRNTPKISEDLWQNYDPGQLFPPEANGMLNNIPLLSPGDGIDPALRGPAQPPQQPQPPPPVPVLPSSQQPNLAMHESGPPPPGAGPAPPAPMQEPPSAHPAAPIAPGHPQPVPGFHQDPQAWNQMHAMQSQQHPPSQADDQWSQTSSTGPIVPATLNVGDWFEFFGIPNADVNALAGGHHAGYG